MGRTVTNSKQLHNAGGRVSFLLTSLPASQKVVFLCKQKVSMVFQKNIQRLDKVIFQSRTVQACNTL